MPHTTLDLAIKKLLVGSIALAAVTLTACQDASSPVAPASGVRTAKGSAGKPGTTETVLFSGRKNANRDIYAMNPDGSNVRRLTSDTARDVWPDFAPDNRKFVWVRYSDPEHARLFTANADGSKPTPLPTVGENIRDPRYSPDGTKIAFTATVNVPIPGGGLNNADVYVINADGTGLKRLTYEQSQELSPTWSPDGQTIAFVSTRLGTRSLFVMNADGLNVRLLLDCVTGCAQPAYSPEGHRLAFADDTDHVIRVIDLDSENLPVAVGPAIDRRSEHPTWTKDGSQILFGSNRGIEGTMELYAGTPGQTQDYTVRRLTVFSPGEAEMPSYSH
jgi:Tol biopolymer transport system component